MRDELASGYVGAVMLVDLRRVGRRAQGRTTQPSFPRPRPASPPAEFLRRYHPRFVAQRHLEIYREVTGAQERADRREAQVDG